MRAGEQSMLVRLTGALLVVAALLIGGAVDAKTRVRYSQGGDSLLFGPIYLARDLGYFDEEGIDLDGAALPAGAKVAAALVGGSLDVVQTAFPHIAKSYEEGIHLVAFAGIFAQLGLDVVFSNRALEKAQLGPDAALGAKASALKGLKVGISSAGSSTDAFARSLIRMAGLNPDTDVSLVPVGAGATTLAAFERGAVDAFVYPLPFPQVAEARGLGRIVISATRGDVPEWTGLLYVVVAAPKKYVDENPKIVLGLTRALGKAMKFIQERPAEAKERLRKVFPKVDTKAMDLSLEAALGAYARTPIIPRSGYETAIKFQSAADGKVYNVPFEAVVNNTFAEQVTAELGLKAR